MKYRIQTNSIPKGKLYDIQRGKKYFGFIWVWRNFGFNFRSLGEAEKKLRELENG